MAHAPASARAPSVNFSVSSVKGVRAIHAAKLGTTRRVGKRTLVSERQRVVALSAITADGGAPDESSSSSSCLSFAEEDALETTAAVSDSARRHEFSLAALGTGSALPILFAGGGEGGSGIGGGDGGGGSGGGGGNLVAEIAANKYVTPLDVNLPVESL